MKRKITSILLVVISLSIAIMGCKIKKIVPKDEKLIEESETSKESEENTIEEITQSFIDTQTLENMLEVWCITVKNNLNFERDFDKNSVNENIVPDIIKLFDNNNALIVASDNNKMLVAIRNSQNYNMEIFPFEINNDSLKLTLAEEYLVWFREICCTSCNGVGRVVIGSHIENTYFACGGCAGAGYTYYQFDTGFGMQQQQIACGICAGTGMQYGTQTINDYAICGLCNSKGVINK